MKRFTYLNGQFLVRELSDCNDLRPKTRAPRNVISMKKVMRATGRIVNAEDEPRYIFCDFLAHCLRVVSIFFRQMTVAKRRRTRARLLRERRERERGHAAA